MTTLTNTDAYGDHDLEAAPIVPVAGGAARRSSTRAST